MDIQVRSRDDSVTPYITGCVVLPNDKLVVVDYNNNKVKLIDNNSIVSQLKLSGYIFDITQVSSSQVAVTSPDTQIIFVVNLGANQLKLDRKLKVEGRCWGIACINEKCVVSYDKPVKVNIIDMDGQVQLTVVTEDKGRELFTSPWHVAVSNDQQRIYISDVDRYTVTSVDLTGQVQAIYTDDKLRRPCALTVDSAGRVYICGEWTNNVLQLTADLTEVQQLLQRSDGVSNPYSVYYCEATARFYIGMWNSDVVKVYQFNQQLSRPPSKARF